MFLRRRWLEARCQLLRLIGGSGGPLPPSGSKGLMLGEILGRRAGLTCTELWLLRFFGSLLFSLESTRLMAPVPVGVAISWGLGSAEVFAVIGALAGPFLSVFRAPMVGVDLSLFAVAVLIGFRTGLLVVFAESGTSMSSMICSISASASAVCSFKLDVGRLMPPTLPACLRIFINDAGVAGSPFVSCKGAAWCVFCFALR